MDYPSFARINERLNAARDSFDRDYNERIAVLNQKEDRLKQRLYELNRKKHETSQATGTLMLPMMIFWKSMPEGKS